MADNKARALKEARQDVVDPTLSEPKYNYYDIQYLMQKVHTILDAVLVNEKQKQAVANLILDSEQLFYAQKRRQEEFGLAEGYPSTL